MAAGLGAGIMPGANRINQGAPVNQFMQQNQGNLLGGFNALDPSQQYSLAMNPRAGNQLGTALQGQGVDPNQWANFINNSPIQYGGYGAPSTGYGNQPLSYYGSQNMSPGSAANFSNNGMPGIGQPTGSLSSLLGGQPPAASVQRQMPGQFAGTPGQGQMGPGINDMMTGLPQPVPYTGQTSGPGPQINNGQPIPLPDSSSGFALNPSAYQNPMENFLQEWGQHDIASQLGAAGQAQSGAGLRAGQQYGQNLAAASSYLPAMQAAEQQQGAGIGLGQYNQGFQYNQALNNQTIPFQQQMALAGLGLQGAQGQAAVNALRAALLSQNAISAGQARGTGTIGQGNALTGGVNSWLQNMMMMPYFNSLQQLLFSSLGNQGQATTAQPTGPG